MVVISDIDDDPLIYRLGFAWRADNVLSLLCRSPEVHEQPEPEIILPTPCSVSAQKVLATGSPSLSCGSLLIRGLARQGGSQICSCSKNTSNHHGSLRFAELNCRLSETRYVQWLS
jgi:hypothetical protein